MGPEIAGEGRLRCSRNSSPHAHQSRPIPRLVSDQFVRLHPAPARAVQHRRPGVRRRRAREPLRPDHASAAPPSAVAAARYDKARCWDGPCKRRDLDRSPRRARSRRPGRPCAAGRPGPATRRRPPRRLRGRARRRAADQPLRRAPAAPPRVPTRPAPARTGRLSQPLRVSQPRPRAAPESPPPRGTTSARYYSVDRDYGLTPDAVPPCRPLQPRPGHRHRTALSRRTPSPLHGSARRGWRPARAATTATTTTAARPRAWTGTKAADHRASHGLIALADAGPPARAVANCCAASPTCSTADGHGDIEMGLFDDVMGRPGRRDGRGRRIELAERLGATAATPPSRPGLASDSIAIAVRSWKARPSSAKPTCCTWPAPGVGTICRRSRSVRSYPAWSRTPSIQRSDDTTLGVPLQRARCCRRKTHEQQSTARRPISCTRRSIRAGRRRMDLLSEMYFVAEGACAAGSWSATPISIRPSPGSGGEGRPQPRRRRRRRPAGRLQAAVDAIVALKQRGDHAPRPWSPCCAPARPASSWSPWPSWPTSTSHRPQDHRAPRAGCPVGESKAADFDRALFLTLPC